MTADEAPVRSSLCGPLPLDVLFDAAAQGVCLVLADKRVAYANPAAASLLGLHSGEAPAACEALLARLRTPDGSPVLPEASPVARALHGEAAADVHLYLEPIGDETPLQLSIGFAPLKGRDGQLAGAILYAWDRTVQYEIERDRDDFLASVAHDLRSPLTAIRGSAQLGQRWARREPPQLEMLEKTLQTIDAAAARLNRMLETLMDSARIARGRLLVQPAPTDLVAIVREVVEHHQREAQRHEFVLSLPDEPLIGEWDAALLERAVENLVNNAVKYSPLGGRIELRCTGEGEAVRFSVRDGGVGIPESALPHIFERFYRARNVSMGEIEGNGLGLFSVKGIVEGHGGTIDVWSVEGTGTEVTVRLPRRPAGEEL